MKVFLIYEEEGQPYHKLAITLPNKWLEQSADKVKECFVERYNKKFPDTPLDDEELVLSVKDESPFTARTVPGHESFSYLSPRHLALTRSPTAGW